MSCGNFIINKFLLFIHTCTFCFTILSCLLLAASPQLAIALDCLESESIAVGLILHYFAFDNIRNPLISSSCAGNSRSNTITVKWGVTKDSSSLLSLQEFTQLFPCLIRTRVCTRNRSSKYRKKLPNFFFVYLFPSGWFSFSRPANFLNIVIIHPFRANIFARHDCSCALKTHKNTLLNLP